MRLRCAISLLVLAGVIATASAQTSAPFTLRISGPGTAASGQEVRIRVLLQNVSDHKITVWTPLRGLLESVHSPSGEEIVRRAGVEVMGSSGNISLDPGGIQDLGVNLNLYYDLSRLGRYTVQFKLPASEDSKDGTITSNLISFTVAPEITQPSVPLKLTLTGPETFVSGSDVKALITNVSDQDIYLVTNADGVPEDRYFHLKAVVGPNNASFDRHAVTSDRQVVRTISPGATLEAKLDKQMLNFDADWIAPRTYRFQLIYSATANLENDLAESNVLTIRVMPPPPGDVTPFRLTLNGPETIAAGDAVRVNLVLKNRSNFEIVGPLNQINLLQYAFSVRDASGRELPLNKQADGIKGANNIIAVQPGDTASSYAILSPFYDLSQPGTYRMQVSQPAYGNPQAGRVFSNVITIQVTTAAP